MTRRYLYGEDHRTVPWATDILQAIYPKFQFRPGVTSIAYEVDGELRAAAFFDTVTSQSCQIGIVSDGSGRWLTREFGIRVIAYVFGQLKLKRVTALISEHNEPSLRLAHKLGFTIEGIMRKDGLKGEDTIVLGLLADECLWPPRRDVVLSGRPAQDAPNTRIGA